MNGCQSTPPVGPRSTVEDPATLLARSDSAAGNRRTALIMQAARSQLHSGDVTAAQATLARLNPEQMRDQPSLDEYHRLTAQIAAVTAPLDAQQALGQLSQWRSEDFLLLADLCQRTGQHQCAADGYIQASLTASPSGPALPSDVNDLIWQHLNRATRAPQMFVHRYHHAWWRLQQDMREAGSISAQQRIWTRFQRRNPSHPASIAPPDSLRNLITYTPPRLGLFLPLTGSLSDLGKAVRDGFIAAYLAEEAQPQINIYDTNSNSLANLWEQALLDNIDVAVGPLLKQNAERLAELSRFSDDVPTLLLNYTAVDTGLKTYQLGIAIEDEATALVQQVLLRGYSRVLLVHSADRWAQRAKATFEEQWPFPTADAGFRDVKNITQAVGEAMQVAASQTRRDELARILGEQLEFLPRARKDLDAVVTMTNQVESRALIPALTFHFAADLPIYATSQATRGEAMAELNGFNLTEMPLFAEPSPRQLELRQPFDMNQSSQADLLALGHDAYKVATWLPILDTDTQLTLPGATGYLWLAEGRRFTRDLPLVSVLEDGSLAAQD